LEVGGMAQRTDGAQQIERTFRLARGQVRSPALRPGALQKSSLLDVTTVREAQEIERRVTHERIAPVDQGGAPGVGSDIARMEIAMDQRVTDAAGLDRREALRQIVEQPGDGARVGASALQRRAHEIDELHTAPIGYTACDELAHMIERGHLDAMQEDGEALALGDARAVGVLTVHMLEQGTAVRARGDERHCAAGHALAEPAQHARLVREEWGHLFEPRHTRRRRSGSALQQPGR
jgi:hypothetical protein